MSPDAAAADAALAKVRFDADGLVPAIVQHADSGRVLTLAYMNRESLLRTLATGETWFWSDEGSGKLQMAGLTAGFDHAALRGDPAQGAFSAFCYKDGRLIGVESVNRAGDHVFARRLLGANKSIAPEQAVDLSFDLKKAVA